MVEGFWCPWRSRGCWSRHAVRVLLSAPYGNHSVPPELWYKEVYIWLLFPCISAWVRSRVGNRATVCCQLCEKEIYILLLPRVSARVNFKWHSSDCYCPAFQLVHVENLEGKVTLVKLCLSLMTPICMPSTATRLHCSHPYSTGSYTSWTQTPLSYILNTLRIAPLLYLQFLPNAYTHVADFGSLCHNQCWV